MRGLVVGGGSIGRRHLQNLRTLGVSELGLVENNVERLRAVSQELGLLGFPDMARGLDWRPAFVVVATPTHLHAEQALAVIERGIDLFVEKPLSHTPARLNEISGLVERKKLISLVGCNMRFHPGPAMIGELLKQGRLGKVLFARIHCGSYLPAWRPNTDYRQNYAAAEETGGGCILDCIHEIDLARWYLGDVKEVFCLAGHLSTLEITTEDVAAIVCRHVSGALSEIHLDYVQRTPERGCQIAGEAGSVFWDINSGQARWYDAVGDRWTTYRQPEGWSTNQIYLEEMAHFLECLQTRRDTVLPIADAIKVMQVVFAAKASLATGSLVATEKTISA